MILFQEYKKLPVLTYIKTRSLPLENLHILYDGYDRFVSKTLVHFVLVFRSAKNQELN